MLENARDRLCELASSWKSEKIYQDGAKIVLAGKTNAGKSSLFNALLKEDRSIVSDIEGTTRDWIESWVSFDGIPARLFDTAGLRKTDDIIEAKGVELTEDLASNADLVLYLVDSSKGVLDDDKKFLEKNKNIPVIVVFNKMDLAGENEKSFEEFLAYEGIKDSVKISAKKGIGIGELTSLVKKTILNDSTVKSEKIGLGSAAER